MNLSFIFNLELRDSEVLCVFRKNKSSASQYIKLINDFCSSHLNVNNPDSISEYKGSSKYYIDLKKYSITDYSLEDLVLFNKLIDIPEITRKERIFRKNLNYYQSHELIVSATKYFINFFKEHKYKLVVMQIVDNYITHIMVKVARYFGIHVVGIVKFFQEGYIRITVEGEHNYLRDPSHAEIDKSYNKIANKEKSAFRLNKAYIYKELIRQYFLFKAKYLIHYLLFHKLMGKLEYDYIGTPSFEYPSKLRNFFPKKYFEKDLSSLQDFHANEMVYIPLHYFPEATTEYWVESPEISPYYPSLFETVQTIANKGYKIVIKEHPAFYLKRDITIYKKLKSIKNVFLISPFTSAYDVVDLVDNVIVWTGTSGIEAIIQNKKVITVSENYYSNNQLPKVTHMEKAKVYNQEEKKRLIKRVLENCLPI